MSVTLCQVRTVTLMEPLINKVIDLCGLPDRHWNNQIHGDLIHKMHGLYRGVYGCSIVIDTLAGYTLIELNRIEIKLSCVDPMV